MSTQYRTKNWHYPVEIVTTNGKGNHPVIYQVGDGNGGWVTSDALPLDHPKCNIEEVPQEPIKIGDTWEKEWTTYVVVTALPNGMWGVFYYWSDHGHVLTGSRQRTEDYIRVEIQEYKERNK